MRAVQFAVRSLHPDRTASAVQAADAGRRAAREATQEFAVDLLDERWTARTFDQFDGSFSVWGFCLIDGVTAREPVPAGMRYDKRDNALVPAKRTDEGKVLAKEMSRLGYSYPLIDGLGGIVHGYEQGPEIESHLRRGFLTGWSFHVFDLADGPAVFATLSLKYLDERSQLRVIDEDGTWDTARLSEFHAAYEEHQERTP